MSVPFEEVFNFRDLGGHRTADGRAIRPGRLFRSDDLAHLTAADRQQFAALGIRTVVDLRRPHEIARHGRIAEFGDFTYHNLHLVHPKWIQRHHPDTADRVEFLRERYDEMITQGGEAIGSTLRLISDADRAPIVFHCLAGKDRTGIVAAMTLSLLGVPDADIADDYHLSDRAEPDWWARTARAKGNTDPNPRSHIEVSPRVVIVELLETLRARHGSVEAFAATLGVTPTHITAMKTHLLT